MSTEPSADILIRIDTIDQLFNAPAINPFSDKPAITLGFTTPSAKSWAGDIANGAAGAWSSNCLPS